jgi:hypothetical protein
MVVVMDDLEATARMGAAQPTESGPWILVRLASSFPVYVVNSIQETRPT